jgi:hypothetical protein
MIRLPGVGYGWAFWRINEKKDRELKLLSQKVLEMAEAQTYAITKVEAALVGLRGAIEELSAKREV